MSIAGIFSSIGGAVSDLMEASGSKEEAQAYSQAADIAGQNANIYRNSTKLQEDQLGQQIFRTQSGMTATTAGSGLANSGSAMDLMRASTQQGALAKAQVQQQGAINVNSALEQQEAYQAEYSAASAAAKAEEAGGIIQGVSAVAQIGAMAAA